MKNMENFDFEKYTIAMEKCISRMQSSYAASEEKIWDITRDVCELLNISKLIMKKTPIKDNDLLHGKLEMHVFNSDAEADDEPYILTEVTESVVQVDFLFYHKKDTAPWNDFFMERIKGFQKQLFICLGWFSLIDYISYLEYYDSRFHIHNHTFAEDFISYHINQGTIGNWAIAVFGIDKLASINKQFGETGATNAIYNYFKELEKIVGERGCVATISRISGLVFFQKELSSEILSFLHGVKVYYDEEKADKVFLSTNAGVNLDLSGFTSASDVIDMTNEAFNLAHAKAGASVVYIDEGFRNRILNNRFIEQVFPEALKNDEFLVYYQPKINLHDYSLCGAEALVRWVHNDKMIYPDQFIPIIESNFSIKYLDLYMLRHVCQHIRQWINEGREVVPISVNLSRCSVSIPNILETIEAIIDSFDIPHSLIQIELTESASDVDSHDLKKLVEGLRDDGISSAVDDFGTGFSSLSLIQKLPWNVIKIDKSLLHGAQVKGSPENLMFKSITALALGIGLECIVEGVETREDISLLKSCKCYFAQGFYFDKPMPKEEFEIKMKTIDLERENLRFF